MVNKGTHFGPEKLTLIKIVRKRDRDGTKVFKSVAYKLSNITLISLYRQLLTNEPQSVILKPEQK